MNGFALVGALSWLLRQLPGPVIALLDGWSLRIAQQKAEQRRHPGVPPR